MSRWNQDLTQYTVNLPLCGNALKEITVSHLNFSVVPKLRNLEREMYLCSSRQDRYIWKRK